MRMFVPAHAYLITSVPSPTPKPPSAATLLTHGPIIKDSVVSMPPSTLEELQALGPETAKKSQMELPWSYLRMCLSRRGRTGFFWFEAQLLESMFPRTHVLLLEPRTEMRSSGSKTYPQHSKLWECVEPRDGYDWEFIFIDDHSELRELNVAVSVLCFNLCIACSFCACAKFSQRSNVLLYNITGIPWPHEDIWILHPTKPNLW